MSVGGPEQVRRSHDFPGRDVLREYHRTQIFRVEDFHLRESAAATPHRDTFYSPRGANAHVITLILWIFTLAFPVLGILFRRRSGQGKIAAGILVIAARRC